MNEDTIINEGSSAKYFSQIMHMADDDLDPYKYRLYGHYVRVCGGLDRPCTQSVRTIAKITQMSIAKVTESRYALAIDGYITIYKEDGVDGIAVTLVDRWLENIQRYSKPDNRSSCEQSDDNCSHDEHSTPDPVPDTNTPRSHDELKNNLLGEYNLKNIKDYILPFDDFQNVQTISSSVDDATSGIPSLDEQINAVVAPAIEQADKKSKRQRKPRQVKEPVIKAPLDIDPDYKKLVRTTFNAWGTNTAGVSSMLLGLAESGVFSEFKLEPPMTLDELKAYRFWQDRTSDKGYRPEKAETIFNWVDKWRNTKEYQKWLQDQQPKPEPPASKPVEIVREPDFETPSIVQQIWDDALARGENPALAALQYATKKLSANSDDLKEREEMRRANTTDTQET